MKITPKLHKELSEAFDEIQQPRTNYEIEKLVVWAKFTEPQAYAQCVLEMSIKYDNMRLAQIEMTRKEMEIEDIKKKKMTKYDKLDVAKMEIELEQTERAYLGAEREFQYLYHLRRKFPKKYTRKELNDNSPLEFKRRLETQALQDIQANWKIWVSNLEWLRQAEIDIERLRLPEQRDEIEAKYLEEWKLRALIIIPSEHRLTAQQIDDIFNWCEFPTNIEIRMENISESPVDDNYNAWFEKAIKEWCTHIVTLERDQILQKDSLIRLFEFALDNPDACVWAYYNKRQETKEWVHIKLSWWHRRFIKDDWETHELKTLAMWLSIYPTEFIRQLDFPYCKTTNSLSQDSYLSQKLRWIWVKLLCDTNIKIGHKDMKTGKIY